MTTQSFQKELHKYIDNHSSTIEEYETSVGGTLEEYAYDIHQIFDNIYKVNKNSDLIDVLNRAISYSIEFSSPITDGMANVLSEEVLNGQTINSTQKYFREVNNIYVKNNNDYNIEYCPENRDKLIEMNLKSVISIAKRYRGLGLTMDELISAGNYGLCIAYDRYDPTRSKLKDNMIKAANDMPDQFTYQEMIESMQSFLTYGDVLNKFTKSFEPGKKTYKKSELVKWINKNIFNAKFNSVASMWIRAYILIEIDNSSRVIRKPKAEIYKDVLETGSYKREQLIDIDAPVGDDGQSTVGDMLQDDEETYSDLEIGEAYDTYKAGLNKLLEGVKSRDRSVFLKKYGIGLPRPMLPREIAEQEGLSIARVSQIFQTVEQKIQKNAVEKNINIQELFDAAHKLN